MKSVFVGCLLQARRGASVSMSPPWEGLDYKMISHFRGKAGRHRQRSVPASGHPRLGLSGCPTHSLLPSAIP